MPTAYLSPGVYIEEVPPGAVPIQGVSTSTLGMVGPTERGPALGAHLITSWAEYERHYGGELSVDTTYFPEAVRGFFDNGGQLLYCARVVGAGSTEASFPLQTTDAATELVLTAIGPGDWGNNIFVSVADSPTPGTKFRVTLLYYRQTPPLPLVDPLNAANISDKNRREPDVVEDFDALEFYPTAVNDVVSAVNGGSSLVQAAWATTAPAPAVANPSRPNSVGFTQFAGGTYTAPAGPDYSGDMTKPSDQRAGLAALEGIDGIALLAVPDQTHPSLEKDSGQMVADLISQCERLRSRFAILAVPANVSDVTKIITNLPTSSSYAAIYYPSIHAYNYLTGSADYVSPVGHIAGIYARTDEDLGVEHAPANQEVLGILALNTTPTMGPLQYQVTKGDQDVLNPAGVNALRDFRSSQRGVRVWGARTLSADLGWRYIQVRRVFIYLEQSIEHGTQWVVFENNTEATWARVVRSVSNFLESFWRDGGLAGTTQAEAFFVRCDRTTMTAGDIDSGRLICLVGVAPVKPAEFVIFRFSQLTIQAIS